METVPSRRAAGFTLQGTRSFQWQFVLLVAAAAGLTYLPFADLPPLPDDYLQAELGERFTNDPGWLWRDPLYRCRATSIAITSATLRWFGFSAAAFNWTGIALHAGNAVLVYLLGWSRLIGWRISLLAALVFAVRERHQEAVVWYAALPELLVFTFCVASLLLWLKWLEGGSNWLLAAALAAFLLGLASKESAVVLCVALPVAAMLMRTRRAAALAAGVFLLGAGTAYFAASWIGQSQNQHYGDGTFAWGWSFLPVLARSAVRAFWVWGVLALAILAAVRLHPLPRCAYLAGCWVLAGLAPYSFLTYMGQVPSRHHYLASLGVSLVVSLAFWQVRHTRLRRFALVIPVLFLLHNWSYLWTFKRAQFAARAEVVERYLREVDFARRAGRPRPQARELNDPREARRALRFRLGIVDGH